MRMNRRRDVIVTSLKFHKSAGEVRGDHLIEILSFKTRAKKLNMENKRHLMGDPDLWKQFGIYLNWNFINLQWHLIFLWRKNQTDSILTWY